MSHPANITETFIRPIQRKLGLTDDGIDGEKTWGAVYKAIFGADAEQASPAPAVPLEVRSGMLVDDRSEKAIDTLHPRVRNFARQLVRDAAATGIRIIVTSGTRTYAEQDALYAQGRTKPGAIVTKARGGYSNHNFGVAFDCTVFVGANPKWEGPEYKAVGKLGKALGLEWGGDWSSIQDEPHFELHPAWAKGMTESDILATLRARHQSGQDAFA